MLNRILVSIALCAMTSLTAAEPFTYQGQLNDGGTAANGMFEMEFTLRLTSDSSVVAGPVAMVVDVNDGLFSADIDFGDGVFEGASRSMQIKVRPDGVAGSFTELLPWVEIHAAPVSQYSLATRGIFVSSTDRVGIGTTDPGDVRLVVTPNGANLAALFDGGVRIGDAELGTTGTLNVAGPGGAPAIQATSGWYAIRGTHSSTTGTFPGLWGDTNSTSSSATGVRGYVNSASPGSASSGVRGINNGNNGNGYGVHGSHAGGGYGVYGTSVSGRGVYGRSTESTGTNYGVYGASSGSTGSGVFGWATANSGINYGVHGISDSSSGAGVNGYSGDGWGVSGASVTSRGMYGSSISGIGVYGKTSSSRGVFGWATGTGVNYGVRGNTSSNSGYGVWSDGDFGGSGAKFFVQPHPEDASQEIRFVCLEGNESGTYFRGSSRLEGGRAYIEVPEEFRLVSEQDQLTVQVTAMGPDAGLWIESKDLHTIVIAGNGDVEFDYFVNGIRRGYKDMQLVRENNAYVPEIRGVEFGRQFTKGQRQILVENGILNADFTPNEETAAKMGWPLRDPTPEELVEHNQSRLAKIAD